MGAEGASSLLGSGTLRPLLGGALVAIALGAAGAACGGAQQTESAEEREAREAALIRQQLHDS